MTFDETPSNSDTLEPLTPLEEAFWGRIYEVIKNYGFIPNSAKSVIEPYFDLDFDETVRKVELHPQYGFEVARRIRAKWRHGLWAGDPLPQPELSSLSDLRSTMASEIRKALQTRGARHLIRVTQGSGKTTAACSAMSAIWKSLVLSDRVLVGQAFGGYIGYYAPTRKLQDEIVQEFRANHPNIPVLSIHGMDQPVTEGSSEKMCRVTETDLFKMVTGKGLSVKKLLCPTCPFRSSCEYWRRLDQLVLADRDDRSSAPMPNGVLVLTHSHLFDSPLESLGPRMECAVVDENILPEIIKVSGLKEFAKVLASPMPAEASAMLQAIFAKIRAGEHPKSLGYTAKQLKDTAKLCEEAPEEFTLDGLSEEASLRKLQEYEHSRTPGQILRLLADEWKFQRVLPHCIHQNPANPAEFVIRYKREVKRLAKDRPTVFLDGTSAVDIMRQVFPTLTVFQANLERHVDYRLVAEFPTMMSNLTGSFKNLNKILEAIRKMLGGPLLGEKVVIFTYKEVEEFCAPRCQDFSTVAFAHFGAVRGLNEFSDYDVAVIIGRTGLNDEFTNNHVAALTQKMRSLDYTEKPSWHLTTVPHLVPEGKLTIATDVYLPTDELSRAVYESIVYTELAQAAERIRTVNASGSPKRIYQLGLYPIEGLPLNGVLRWAQWVDTKGNRNGPSGRVVNLVKRERGVLIADYQRMVASGVWSTVTAARKDVDKFLSDSTLWQEAGYRRPTFDGRIKPPGMKGKGIRVVSFISEEDTRNELFRWYGLSVSETTGLNPWPV